MKEAYLQGTFIVTEIPLIVVFKRQRCDITFDICIKHIRLGRAYIENQTVSGLMNG